MRMSVRSPILCGPVATVLVLTSAAAVAVAPTAARAGSGAGDAKSDAPPRAVVVELFTSEGCSSCPAADRLLAELAGSQPVPGARIVPLAQHVDYWDSLGWKDPYSSAEATSRQRAYAAHGGSAGIYTPQMIVDGREEFVGSDRRAALRAILKAAGRPAVPLELTVRTVTPQASGPAQVDWTIRVPRAPEGEGPWEVRLALIEDGLGGTEIPRGENAGRALRHDGVVRMQRAIGHVGPGGRDLAFDVALRIDPAWDASRVRAVAFLQQRVAAGPVGPIDGAAMAPWPASGAVGTD